MRSPRKIPRIKSRIIDPDVPSAEEIRAGLSRRLGYSDAVPVPEALSSQFQKALAEALKWVRPRATYRLSSIEKIGKKVIVGNGFQIESQRWARVAHRMDSPEILLVYALTLGEDLDRRITSIQNESLSLAFILDAAGSEIVERVADLMEADLWQRLDLIDYQRTARFSPGYCDWELEGQQSVFAFLDPEKIGIHCTKAWSMWPSKSITAVVLGAKTIPFLTPCPLCTKKACPYRIVNTLDELG